MKVATNRDETRPKVRLYHGSNVEVKKPSLRMGRKKTDFGRGFYTTTQKEQAEHWTSIKLDRAKKGRKIESGVLDAPAAIAELKAYKTYNQLSFHTQRVIVALRFVESYEVKEGQG